MAVYKPTFHISPDLLRLVAQATELKSWVAGAVVDVSWLPRLQRETASRLAHSSTAIEGNTLSLPEVEALERGEPVGGGARAEQEVVNAIAAMRWVWRQPAPSEAGLLRLHRLLTEDTLPAEAVGRYKTKDNKVVDARGRTVYAPPPAEQARALTRELLAWLSSAEARGLHPIITSAVAHHRLVSIHPFSDGNGRAARALAVWVLYSRGFDTHHLVAIDEFFERDRKAYYDKLQQVRDLDDDLSLWLEYAAEAVVDALKRIRERILSLQVSAKVSRIALTKRQEEVLRIMRDRGRVRSPDLEKTLRLTRARVGQIVKPLVDAGLVVREGRTRATSYRLA